MGVLNMTPDSFSDGGEFNSNSKALIQITKMIESGADIIDIGGESTRPGSKIISPKIEWERVSRVIKKFKKKFPKTLLSIDTRKSLVVKNAIKKKADIINDVSCFKFDKEIYKEIKNRNVWKVIHHMQGTPQTMQVNPKYDNVILDIYDFFEEEINKIKKDNYSHKSHS
jgi:dihydropteroate synthase